MMALGVVAVVVVLVWHGGAAAREWFAWRRQRGLFAVPVLPEIPSLGDDPLLARALDATEGILDEIKRRRREQKPWEDADGQGGAP